MKNQSGMSLIALVVIIVVVIIIGILCTVLILKNGNRNTDVTQLKSEDIKIETTVKEDKNDNNDPIGKYIIYLNDFKIILGKTKIDDIIKNSKLQIKDDYSELSYREVTLISKNYTVEIKGMNKDASIIKSITIKEKEESKDIPFNVEKVADIKVVCVDNTLNRNMSLGDTFVAKDIWEFQENDNVWSELHVSQTKYLSKDCFDYELERNEEDSIKSETDPSQLNPNCRYNLVGVFATLSYDNTY